MSDHVRLRWSMICFTIACLLAILLLRIVLTTEYGYIGGSYRGQGTADEGGLSAAFKIEGDATAPISPGVSVPLDLKFTNPHQEWMTVTRLRVSVQRLTAPGADRWHPCSLKDYGVTQVKTSIKISLPPNATSGFADLAIPREAWPKIGMPNRAVNQDGCRGARLKLGYTAFGSLVGA